MVTLSQTAALAPEVTRGCAVWYGEHQVPAAFRQAHPLVLARARTLSGGDWLRCVIDDDGSITVCNERVWFPE